MINVVNRKTPDLISGSQVKAGPKHRAVAGDLVCDGVVVLEHFNDENGYGYYHVRAQQLFCVSFYDDTGTQIVSQYQTSYPAGQDASFEEPYGLACGACMGLERHEKPDHKEKVAAQGKICINLNSAGGTCDHLDTEHVDGTGACTLCDCPSFIPNA
jgi:hypothetical protein